MFPLSQIPAPPSGAIETWLLCFAAIGSIAVLVKKLIATKPPNPPEFITRAEFYREMLGLREKIGGGFMADRDAIDQTKGYLTLTVEKQTASIHSRLSDLETLVARVDERTKPA